MKREVRIGDCVRTDWALGSKDGRTHYGVLLQIGPGRQFGKVDWNTAGPHAADLPRYVPVATLEFVSDGHVASRYAWSQVDAPQVSAPAPDAEL